ncbi:MULTISPECIES: hypothetical protein [Paenibacillus]|uniref:hypothetical protein n=1 Tax=Paenibacillus TaxID=44249 RepID=UPI0022B90250|nr:hypothetical protein [Paenibacillus caseinilyticus]MCZ8520884.1 hypothetical protein [Paenibacillus caseinilyticus]
MAILIFCSISVLLILTLSVTKRRLHVFEGIIVWVFTVLLQNNFHWLFGLNYKLVELSHDWIDYLVYDTNRSIIVPIGMMLFLELHTSLDRKWKKLLNGAMFVALFVGLEYLGDVLGILSHSRNWRVWFSFANWALNLAVLWLAFKGIRSIARKEVRI